MGVEVSAPHCEGGNNETGSTKQSDQVQHVHVFWQNAVSWTN